MFSSAHITWQIALCTLSLGLPSQQLYISFPIILPAFLFYPFLYAFYVLLTPAGAADPGQLHVFLTDMYCKYVQFRELAIKGLPQLEGAVSVSSLMSHHFEKWAP